MQQQDWGKFFFDLAVEIRPWFIMGCSALMLYVVAKLHRLTKKIEDDAAAAVQERAEVKKKVEETHQETLNAVKNGAANKLAKTIIEAEEGHNDERQQVNRG